MWAFVQNRQIKRLVALEAGQEAVTVSSSHGDDLELEPWGEGYSEMEKRC